MLELAGLVFLLDADDLKSFGRAFEDAVFNTGYVKELHGPIANGTIAITVDLEKGKSLVDADFRRLGPTIKMIEAHLEKTLQPFRK